MMGIDMMSDTLRDGWMPFVRRSKYMSSASAAGPDAVQLVGLETCVLRGELW
jgi:hypothetical protein